ncbi:MFS transporter [Paenibacillus sp. CF384]|uniref:MFS transporter n=1 Tax=Paenibacillus sp. CF384 TaxID=1884382 RepID=UPI000896D4BA|nr:MFS transporter [Paenibacillus sp. CF384]SDX32598.1 Predicted arabinose efflux permease, MFS family [Paenibacillus sp. CF384]
MMGGQGLNQGDEEGRGHEHGASRWSVIAAYAGVVAVTQLLWVTFTPITTDASELWGVSIDAVGWLSLVFPLVYVLLSIPFGFASDRSFRGVLTWGAGLTVAGALIRVVPGYEYALAGQFIIAVGQPLVLGAVNKMAVLYAAPPKRPIAIAAGTASLFVGIMISNVTVPFLLEWGGMPAVLWTQAIMGAAACLALLVTLRKPPLYEGATTDVEPAPALRTLRALWSQQWVRLFSLLLFAGFGIFITLATWLEVLADAIGYDSVQVGTGLGLMTAAGIIGAAVLPDFAMHGNRARNVLVLSLAVSAVLLVFLAAGMPAWLFMTLLALAGLLLLADLPIVLSFAEAKAEPRTAGAVTGLLLLFGNLGGIVLSLLVQLLLDERVLAIGALAVVTVVILPFALLFPGKSEPHK